MSAAPEHARVLSGVRFCDPEGRRLIPDLVDLAAVAVILFAVFGPLEAEAPRILLGSVAALVSGVLRPVWRQRTSRPVRVVLGPGYVDVKGAPTRNQRIRARDLKGATTARTATGFLLTLSLRTRDQPITFETESEPELDGLRSALGIGHGGFGAIRWRTCPSGNERAAIIGRTASALAAALVLAVAAVSGFSGAAVMAAFVGVLILPWSLFLTLIGGLFSDRQPNLIMSSDGIRFVSPFKHWQYVPYADLIALEASATGLAFALKPPHAITWVKATSPGGGGGLSTFERAGLVAQIEAAAQRARGLGKVKDDVTGRVDVLLRRGEDVRSWLARLDRTGQLLASGAGYRGVDLDQEALWAILEDPDASLELRTAASRVLSHATEPEARVRIEAAHAATRDDLEARRLRVALAHDLDAASEEIALLEVALGAEEARAAGNARRSGERG